MLKGAILEEDESDYIDMNRVFLQMSNLYQEYNWLVSDIDYVGYPSTKISANEKYIWLTSKELEEMISQTKIQYMWGVFSGFQKDIKKEDVFLSLSSGLPVAEGCDVWKSDFQIQHPLAQIEIIAWEGTYLIMISKSQELVHQFQIQFPKAEDLYEYNKSRGW